MGRACVIGAGSSGIAACQVLHARGIPFDCFESGSAVGGNWRYNNDNGMSSAADLLQERASLPSEPEMNREIARYRAVTARRYAGSGRPAIQVDFLAYLKEIARERRAGASRDGARPALAPHPAAPRSRPVSQPLRLA